MRIYLALEIKLSITAFSFNMVGCADIYSDNRCVETRRNFYLDVFSNFLHVYTISGLNINA